MRFFLDHDVPGDVALLLRHWKHEAVVLGDVLPAESSDEAVFGYARRQGLITITCNRNPQLNVSITRYKYIDYLHAPSYELAANYLDAIGFPILPDLARAYNADTFGNYRERTRHLVGAGIPVALPFVGYGVNAVMQSPFGREVVLQTVDAAIDLFLVPSLSDDEQKRFRSLPPEPPPQYHGPAIPGENHGGASGGPSGPPRRRR